MGHERSTRADGPGLVPVPPADAAALIKSFRVLMFDAYKAGLTELGHVYEIQAIMIGRGGAARLKANDNG